MTKRTIIVLRFAVSAWLLGAMTALLICLATLFGGSIQEYLYPIVGNIQLDQSSIRRDKSSLCFSWTSDKLRLEELDSVNTSLDRVANNDRWFPDIKDSMTGASVHRNGSHKIGPDDRHEQCVALPADAKPDEVFDLKITALFHGWRGFWYVPVQIPTVHSTGVTTDLPTP